MYGSGPSKIKASELRAVDQIVGSDNSGGKLKYGRVHVRLKYFSVFVQTLVIPYVLTSIE